MFSLCLYLLSIDNISAKLPYKNLGGGPRGLVNQMLVEGHRAYTSHLNRILFSLVFFNFLSYVVVRDLLLDPLCSFRKHTCISCERVSGVAFCQQNRAADCSSHSHTKLSKPRMVLLSLHCFETPSHALTDCIEVEKKKR